MRCLLSSVVFSVVFLAACGDARCPTGGVWTAHDGVAGCVDGAGVREGPYVETAEDGTVLVTGVMAAGVLSGPYSASWPDGTPKSQGQWVAGVATGRWQRWAEDGVALPDVTRGVAGPPVSGHGVLAGLSPNPSVLSVTALETVAGTPRRYDDEVVVPTTTGLSGLDALTGEVRWEVASTTLMSPWLAGGLRTAVSWTADGDALVVWLDGSEWPAWRRFHLAASPTPRPAANDFGAVYVDASGVIHDAPWDATHRDVPDVSGVTALVVSGDRLLVGTVAGELVQWERVASRRRWAIDLGAPVRSIATPDWHRSYVVAGHDLVAVAFTDGTVTWRAPLPTFAGEPTVSAVGERVWVTDGEQTVAVNAKDGTVIRPPPVDVPVVPLGHEDWLAANAETVRVLGPSGPRFALRLDAIGAPLVEENEAWMVSRAGNVMHAQVLPAGPPTLGDAPPASNTVLRVDGEEVVSPEWSVWSDHAGGVRRTALDLTGYAGQDLRVTVTWFDLPALDAPMTRTWSQGWTFTEAPGWATQVGDVQVISSEPPQVGGPALARLPDGVVGDVHLEVGAETRVLTSTGAVLASAPRAGVPVRVRSVGAVWEGRVTVPWLTAWTEAPRGWTGWIAPPPMAAMTSEVPLESAP